MPARLEMSQGFGLTLSPSKVPFQHLESLWYSLELRLHYSQSMPLWEVVAVWGFEFVLSLEME